MISLKVSEKNLFLEPNNLVGSLNCLENCLEEFLGMNFWFSYDFFSTLATKKVSKT